MLHLDSACWLQGLHEAGKDAHHADDGFEVLSIDEKHDSETREIF